MATIPSKRKLGTGLLAITGVALLGLWAIRIGANVRGPQAILVLGGVAAVALGLVRRSSWALGCGHGAVGAAFTLALVGHPSNLIVAAIAGTGLLVTLELANGAIERRLAITWESPARRRRRLDVVRIVGIAMAAAVTTSLAGTAATGTGPVSLVAGSLAALALGALIVGLARRVVGNGGR